MEREDILREIQILGSLMNNASHVGDFDLAKLTSSKIKKLLEQL